MHSQSKKKKRKKVSSRKRMSGESGQLWPSHHQLPLSLCIWKGRFEKLALARRKAQGCVFVKASVKSCLRFKTGDASIISHRHIVWANWSLCLNNINLGSIFCPPLHTHAHVFNIAFLLSSHTTSAALSSAVPEKKIWWRARRMTRNNGAINSHLCFLRWPCHRRLQGSEVRQAKCQQHSATRCTSSHSADLKSVASIWGKAEKKTCARSASPSALHLCCSALLLSPWLFTVFHKNGSKLIADTANQLAAF